MINVNLKRIALGTGVFILIGIIIITAVRLYNKNNDGSAPDGFMVEKVIDYERKCI